LAPFFWAFCFFVFFGLLSPIVPVSLQADQLRSTFCAHRPHQPIVVRIGCRSTLLSATALATSATAVAAIIA